MILNSGKDYEKYLKQRSKKEKPEDLTAEDFGEEFDIKELKPPGEGHRGASRTSGDSPSGQYPVDREVREALEIRLVKLLEAEVNPIRPIGRRIPPLGTHNPDTPEETKSATERETSSPIGRKEQQLETKKEIEDLSTKIDKLDEKLKKTHETESSLSQAKEKVGYRNIQSRLRRKRRSTR